MTPSSSVRICTIEELTGQAGLDPLLEHFVALGSNSLFDPLIFLDLPSGEFGLMGASLESGRIAHLQSLAIPSNALREHRWALWQAGIVWAVSQRPAAIQIYCSSAAEDQEILAELGYPVTTAIVALGADVSDRCEPPDPAIRDTSYECELPGLAGLIDCTLVGSLDVPESIPLHGPEELLRSWVGESPANETILLVAEAENERVGLLVATFARYADDVTGYQINYLGVAVDHRRQGWGSRLLNQFLRRVHAAGVPKVSVFTDQRNVPAIQLYQQFGFREFEELRMPIVFQRLGGKP